VTRAVAVVVLGQDETMPESIDISLKDEHAQGMNRAGSRRVRGWR